MPTSQKQTCYIYHPDYYGPRHHGYSPRPVCPVPESSTEEIILWSEEKRAYIHWYPNGGVAQFDQDGTETFWMSRPTLANAVNYEKNGKAFFRFFSNGDIQVILNGEPLFFSGMPVEVETEKGEIIDMTPPESDAWSDSDRYSEYSYRECGCCRR